MRITIKGSIKKIVSLYKELKLRVKRDNLDMVISKSKAEEEDYAKTEQKAVEAKEKSKAAKREAIDLVEKNKKETERKAEAKVVADMKAKAAVRDSKMAAAVKAEKAKADKKAELKAEEA